MPKVNKKQKENAAPKQRVYQYQKKWERENWAEGWLKSITNAPEQYRQLNSSDTNLAFCNICQLSLRAHKADLQRHVACTTHKSKIKSLNLSTKQKISNYLDTPISDQAKVADIKLSIFAAKHMSILAVGHLSELIASETKGTGSYLENLRLHRTKCAAIIKYVVSPSLLSSLVTAIGDNKYSLIVDESTDVSCTKWMCLCVRYFNTKKGEIMTDFLGLFLVGEATAECLYDSTIEFLTKINLKIQNMLAIGTDGANNLCGQYKSLYALLKKQNPKLILMKCTCHSLALCCSKSSKMIPEDSEFLVRELYNYFSHSPLRTLKYRETFDLLNTGVDANSFRKLIQIANTRWLSYGSAVKRVLEQWTELKCHFKIIAQNEGDMARMILSRMEDDQVRLYLLFLNPILHDINRLNIKLQSDKVDVGSVYTDMSVTFLSLASKVMKPVFLVQAPTSKSLLNQVIEAVSNDLAYLQDDDANLGIEFIQELNKSSLSFEVKKRLKRDCVNYLKKLLYEMKMRLPDNMDKFEKYKLFSPGECLMDTTGRKKFSDVYCVLKDFLKADVSLSSYENQWNKLPFVNWKDHFSTEIPRNIVLFWPKVYSFQDASGNFFFQDIAEAVIRMLLIPTSNACVERIFSVMNLTKNKLRNKMQYELLESIMRIIIYMNTFGICCKNFKPTADMLSRFNSKHMYMKSTEKEMPESEEDQVFESIQGFDW